ncbi:Trigger factor [Maioricimonas rarisocia]|uniref:Trigger factor n=1 Tax=Maioricimonas rarisocia TaxID=2528026 RepID=A0A517Z9J9_9PLAN|nr:trigger factor [Maioricimonas rarisocia]QDU39143.1 Trigger factor [Maioricimonas rarisocia]
MADAEKPQAVMDDAASGAAADEAGFERLQVNVESVGPCKKHVRVTVPREVIDDVMQGSVDELMTTAAVPGFRVGHVPEPLIRRRFRSELTDQVKQKVLMQSLEWIAQAEDLDPINEPNLDVESIEVPDEGDFEYEFDVEVRPEFDLPEYKGLKIERPEREITDEDVDAYLKEFVEQYGQLEPIDEPASLEDFVTVEAEFVHGDQVLHHVDELSLRVRPVLRFQDAELEGFDKEMVGAKEGDARDVELKVSMEADNIAMRGETVTLKMKVLDVKRLRRPELDDEFLARLNVESEEQLRAEVRKMLERQVTYEQRQSTRRQVLEKITESADWELPEDLVRKQVDNALRREILEMQQAGFTRSEIAARENDLRQKSISMTRQNLKEHFVLDRIAEEENIEVTSTDIEMEITMMALQRGENPRRVRARLVKSGMIENLEAQIRERKAVDVILENAEFQESTMAPPTELSVEAVNRSVCGSSVGTTDEEDEEAGEE